MEKDEKAGFKPSNHHKYRVFRFVVIIPYGHTYAVMAIQNGDDIKTVQHNLGHASAAFTLDVYGHVSDRMRDDSSTRMQNYILSLQTL